MHTKAVSMLHVACCASSSLLLLYFATASISQHASAPSPPHLCSPTHLNRSRLLSPTSSESTSWKSRSRASKADELKSTSTSPPFFPPPWRPSRVPPSCMAGKRQTTQARKARLWRLRKEEGYARRCRPILLRADHREPRERTRRESSDGRCSRCSRCLPARAQVFVDEEMREQKKRFQFSKFRN